MIDLSQFALFFAAAFLLAVTPGPESSTLPLGRCPAVDRRGFASSFGNGLGGMFHVLAGSLGVSAIVLASAELFTALKLVGAAYLVWMGVQTFLSACRDAQTALSGRTPSPPVGARRAFRDGVMVEVLNPKTAAFYLAFIPQFVDLNGHVALQFVLLGAVSVALNTLADIVVAFADGGIRDSATARPNLIRRLREGSGGAMVLLGVGLALARRPTH